MCVGGGGACLEKTNSIFKKNPARCSWSYVAFLPRRILIVVNISVRLTENEILLENTTSVDFVGTGDKRLCLEQDICCLGYWRMWGRESSLSEKTLAWFGVNSLLYISILVLRIYRIPVSPSWECSAASL